MYAVTIDKLSALLSTWDPAFQCVFFCVLVGAVAGLAANVLGRLYRAFELAVGLLKSVATLPVGVIWGWPGGCDCARYKSGEDEDDEDDE